MYSTAIRSQLNPAVNEVTSVHAASCFVVVINNNAEKRGTPFEGEVHPESHISQGICYAFTIHFSTSNHRQFVSEIFSPFIFTKVKMPDTC